LNPYFKLRFNFGILSRASLIAMLPHNDNTGLVYLVVEPTYRKTQGVPVEFESKNTLPYG
jgi:hypothetical protein